MCGRDLNQHFSQCVGWSRHADVLSHRQNASIDGEVAAITFVFAGQDLENGAFADAIGPNQSSMLAWRNAETDIKEKLVSSWRCVFKFGDDDAAHTAHSRC